jgi:hypothetical protein
MSKRFTTKEATMQYVVISENKPCFVGNIGPRKYYRMTNKFRRFCVVHILRLFGTEFKPKEK